MFFLFYISIFSLVSIYSYKIIWNKLYVDKVPKGVGIVLVFIFCCILFFEPNLNIDKKNVIAVLIFILSIFYWIDDIKSLSTEIRIFIQFIAGFSISFLLLNNIFEGIAHLIILSTLFGIVSIFLTNMINFYDGADLNVSLFSIINYLILLFIFREDYFLSYLIMSVIVFFVIFSIFNIFPKTIYFGDSGCFLLSCIFILFICEGINLNKSEIIFVLIGFSLPILDVIYVIMLRIYLNESLVSRNYHHLYQQLQIKLNNYFYLYIQIINSVLIIVLINLMKFFSDKIFYNTIIASLLMTLFSYFFIRAYIIRDFKK